VSAINTAIERHYNLRNLIHTILLVAITGLLAGVMAWTVFGTTGLIYAAAYGAAGIYALGRISPAMVLKMYKARVLETNELPELHHVIRDLAARADLPAVPRLYYVPSQMLNAFAVGRREDSAIAITDGLLRAMSLRQIAGIVAHEIAHVKNGDLKVMGLADVLNRITGFMSTLGLLGIPALFGMGWNIPVTGLLLLIFAPTIGGLLQLALSRAREFDADLDGASLTGDPEGLASALAHLEKRQQGKWEGLMLPGSRFPEPSLLRSHPKTEDRIARLMALKSGQRHAYATEPERAEPGPSIIPPIGRPKIRWQRFGVWY